MDVKHKDLLRLRRVSLCNKMNGEAVASHLYSEGIISSEDKDYISLESTPFKRNEILLDILPKRGSKAFFVFCNALKKVDPDSEVLLQFGDDKPSAGNELEPPCKKRLKENDPEGLQDTEEEADDEEDGKCISKFEHRSSMHSNQSQNQSSTLGQGIIAMGRIDSDCYYNMEKSSKGLMILINNKDFLPSSTMEKYPREGTDIDAKALTTLFKEMGFKVEPYDNRTCSQMEKILEEASTRDFSDTNCFVCAILSHGQEGVIYGTDGTISIKKITEYFCRKNLAGKPKIFIFQACQETEYMESVDVTDGPADDKGNKITLPIESDFLYAYSTVPGYYSWQNSRDGSWFIQAIVKVFRQRAHKMDIVRMLTRVNAIVSTKRSSTNNGNSHNKRQIPSIISQLRKEFYFNLKGPLKSA